MKLRFEVQICVVVSYFFHISAKSVKLNTAGQDKNDKTSKKVDAEDMTGASVNLYRVLMHKHVNEEKIEEDKGVKPKHKHNKFRMWNIQNSGHESQNCMNLTLQMDSIVSTTKQ